MAAPLKTKVNDKRKIPNSSSNPPTPQKIVDTVSNIPTPAADRIPTPDLTTTPKATGQVQTTFHNDGSVTHMDEYGYTQQYKDRATYEQAQRINDQFLNTQTRAQAEVDKGLRKPTQQEQDAAKQAELQKQADLPVVQPAAVGADKSPPKVDFLDVGGTVGGGVGGAAVGAKIGAIGGGVGAAIGAGVGALVGAGTAFFTGQGAEQKQYTKEVFTDFTLSTGNVDKIMNNANGGVYSPQQNRAFMENELQRIYQTQRELKTQAKQLFGEKLSKNQDERAKIDNWLRNWEERGKFEFEAALLNPNPTKVSNWAVSSNEVSQ